MTRIAALLLAATAVAGCSMEMPQFLGRTGTGATNYQLGGPDLPDRQALALRSLRAEPALGGVIIRATGVAPAQGFHSAEFVTFGPADGGDGTMRFDLTAFPPEVPVGVGPENTRTLSAAFFLPDRMTRDVRAVQVRGAGSVQTVALPSPAARP